MNFNTLYAAIQNELNDYGSRTGTRIVKWINEGHKSICQRRRWSFLVVRTSDEMSVLPAGFPFNIETGIKVATTTTAAQNIIAMWDTTDGTYQEVKQTTHEQLRDHYPTDVGYSVNPLLWYYLTNKTIAVFPETSETRKFIFSFQKKLSTYVAGSTDALLIPDEYIDVLQDYVLFKAYLFKSDDRAEMYKNSYKDLLAGMIEAESNKSGIIYDDFSERAGGYVPMVSNNDSISDSFDFTVVTAGVEVEITHNLGVVPTEVLPVVKPGKESFANVYSGTTEWTITTAYLTASLAGDYSVCFRTS